MQLKILIIDDEPTVGLAVSAALRHAGHDVRTATDGAAGIRLVAENPVDVVLTDMHMPGMSGMGVLKHLQQVAPEINVVIMTAYNDAQQAVQALRHGAVDYLIKPLDMDELLWRLERIARQLRLTSELRDARAQLSARDADAMIGQSGVFTQLVREIDMFASAGAPVLIQGESGTGKELVARRIHAMGTRPTGPFVAVNCAALPDALVESELFGAERGAFTGATRKRLGRFGAADGGTLFLDEVAELPLAAQAKLLRVLQEGTIEPLGRDEPVEVDVRIVAATHRDLKQWVARGTFREDLYYRLNVLSLVVPPLRERAGDLLLLTQHFMSRMTGRGVASGLSTDAWDALRAWSFPGNIRELEHAIQYAVVVAQGGEILREHLPEDIAGRTRASSGRASGFNGRSASGQARPAPAFVAAPARPVGPLRAAADVWEREYLIRALEQTGGHRTRAAALLEISRKSLWLKLKKHNITLSDSSQ